MQGAYGGLIIIINYGNGIGNIVPETDDFLLLVDEPFLLLDGTNFLLL